MHVTEKGDDSRIRLLLMDDEPDLLVLLGVNAELSGEFNVVATAKDGDEVIELARELRPDAVILDHVIESDDHEGLVGHRSPMTGLESVQYLRSFLPDAVIVVYSGKPGIGRSAAEVGADFHFVKGDAGPDAVLDTVAKAWHGRH